MVLFNILLIKRILLLFTSLSHQVLSKAVKVFEGGRCGKEIGICSDGYCCSKFGWCGDKDLHCKVEHDCQSNFWYLSRKI